MTPTLLQLCRALSRQLAQELARFPAKEDPPDQVQEVNVELRRFVHAVVAQEKAVTEKTVENVAQVEPGLQTAFVLLVDCRRRRRGCSNGQAGDQKGDEERGAVAFHCGLLAVVLSLVLKQVFGEEKDVKECSHGERII
jgi:hypothetical protein